VRAVPEERMTPHNSPSEWGVRFLVSISHLYRRNVQVKTIHQKLFQDDELVGWILLPLYGDDTLKVSKLVESRKTSID
jgi:hypothetical protein